MNELAPPLPLVLVAAVARNGVIGGGNRLLPKVRLETQRALAVRFPKKNQLEGHGV